MPGDKINPLDAWIIDQIKRREQEKADRKRRENEQPQIPLDIPENDPDENNEERRKKDDEDREKRDNPRGVEEIDMI